MSETPRSDVERLVRIDSIADHLDLVELLAQWHWDEWGHADPHGPLATWAAGLRERTNRAMIPTTFVALASDELLGSVTLVEHDMATRRDLSPWLAGLYVTPAFRGQGVGSTLARHAVRQAAAMGVPRLYLHTATARGLYERLGWRSIASEWYEDELVTVMTIEASLNHGGPMSQRAHDLAERFAQVSEAFAAEMEVLTPAQWAAFVLEEKRTVAAMARHVGWAYGVELAVISAIAEGRPYEPLNDAGLAEINAAHGEEFAECDQADTVAFLRNSAAPVAAEIRSLSDEQLARTGLFQEEFSEESAGDLIEYVLIGHPGSHLPAIRNAAESAAAPDETLRLEV